MPSLKTTFIIVTLFATKLSLCQKCGIERWSVKTLSDKDTIKINFSKIIPSSIHKQLQLLAPKKKTYRLDNESVVYSINCLIVGYKKERNDQDIHIVIQDAETKELMVAEIPSYECTDILHTSRSQLYKELQNWFRYNIGKPKTKFVYLKKPVAATIKGLGFFDFCHGQKGMAPNGREIHPVLSIQFNSN